MPAASIQRNEPTGARRATSWRVRATDVQSRNLGLRWTVSAWTGDHAITVTADTSREGRLFDLQAGEYVGTTGDERLDHQVSEYIAALVAWRKVSRQLDRIERAR